MPQHCCFPSLLTRWLLCCLFLAAVSAWAIGLCAVNVAQVVPDDQKARTEFQAMPFNYTVKTSLASSTSNCSMPTSQNVESNKFEQLPSASLIVKSRLRGLSFRESIYIRQQLHQSHGHPCDLLPVTNETSRNTTTSEAPRPHSKRRRLNVCTTSDISITQGLDSSHGIPEFVVEVVNTCLAGCSPTDIHISCGWFASALLVNPALFRRIAYDDCLVNNGNPLNYGNIIRFQYANSFMYPLRIKSAKLC